MYLFIECWKARREWLDLSKKARIAYMNSLSSGITTLLKSGVEMVSWSMNEQVTASRAPYDYFAVWKFPTREMADGFEKIIENSGWYTYFDQVNLKGEISTPDFCIEKMIAS